jgi:hypothetical protein
MWPETALKKPEVAARDRRIDLIRGVAVLGMIFVNTPRKLFIFGFFALIAAEVAKAMLIGNLSFGHLKMAFDADFFLISSDPFPPSAFYLLSAGGVGLMIIAGCCGLSKNLMNRRWQGCL